MYDLVEVCSPHTTDVEVFGSTLPVPSVVEDPDGVRLLLLGEARVLDDIWSTAYDHHRPAAIVVAEAPVFAWMRTDEFIEGREHHHQHYVPPPGAWTRLNEPLTYRQMLTHRPQESVPEPSGEGFVSLHVHSEFSAFDGLSLTSEITGLAAEMGQPAVALTDHGTCAGHPALQVEADKVGIKPIFGIEAYFVDDRLWRPGEGEKDHYNHLILWAMDNTGLRNLWAMSTEGFRDGFYKHPRIDWDTLTRLNEGVMCSTACLGGPVAQLLLAGDEERARMRMARLLDIFGDRLYAELHTNGLDEQATVNKRLVSLAHDLSVPLIAVTDTHYPTSGHKRDHQVWMAMQTDNDLQDETGLFEGDTDYGMLSEAEVRKALATHLDDAVVGEAVANTMAVSNRCTARIPYANDPPIYSQQGGVQRDVERLVDLCMGNWERKVGDLDEQTFEVYADRFDTEMRLLIDKGFCGYFLMVADYARWAKNNGILVGPGRGSGGGSLVAYLSDITEIEPIEADLMFERFLTPGRESLPDFDLDFPASRRGMLQDHLRDRWGNDYVVRVGTHLRLKSKGVIRKLGSTLDETIDIDWRDIDKMSTIIKAAESDTAGLGLVWDELWEVHGDLTHAEAVEKGDGDTEFTLEVARARYPMLFDYADGLVGRLHSYGKHAAGFVISTSTKLTENLPLRLGEDGMVTQFDMDALEGQGYIKFDLLTLRTLDTIQQAVDLIEERHGVRVDPNDRTSMPHDDAAVWDDLCEGHVLGVFQVEKVAGKRMCKRLQPRSIADLAAVITLIRPGPMRSGLTDLYLRRRHGEEEVFYPHPWLADVLDRTYGAMIYQEDIMATCRVMAGYDLGEADEVRRILGKKKVEKVIEEGERFLARCADRGVERGVAEDLWAQMGEFAKYGFNRAHAWGYALLGYWCAWLKVNYPVEFLTAILSTVKKDRIPEFAREARRLGISVLPPDVNESGKGFTAAQSAVRYGLDSIKGVGDAASQAIIDGQPYASWEEFREHTSQKGCKANIGHVEILASVGAFDSIYPNRRALETLLEREKSGEADKCVFKDEGALGPNGLPCIFDWDSEPAPVSKKTGKELKKKPIPKRCTRACRNYTPPPPMDTTTVDAYTSAQIREREKEMLGVFLTSTPFDDVPEGVWDEFEVSTSQELESGHNGEHVIIGMLTKRRPHVDRSGRNMGFLAFEMRDGETIDVVSFSATWETYSKALKVDRLYAAVVDKNSRGYSLKMLVPL